MSVFHPFEVAFCGYSGTGKTTLIEKLVKAFSSQMLNIGYLKHDAHKFKIDHEGKDSFRLAQAGSKKVIINDQAHWASVAQESLSPIEIQQQFIQCDWLFIEGYKKIDAEKIVFLDEKTEILNEFKDLKKEKILAFVYTGKPPKKEELLLGVPLVERNDIQKIEELIQKNFASNVNKDLIGLVLAGGFSTRMKQDKGALSYYGRSQVQYMSDLLSPMVKECYVSVREQQLENNPHLRGLSLLVDKFPSKGPMAGILSGLEEFPHQPILVVACDLPLVAEDVLQDLIDSRNPYKVATCFLNPEKGWPEPLCTLWEPKAKSILYSYLGIGRHCPRKILFNSSIESIEVKDRKALQNANTPEDYDYIKKQIEVGL
ncbi:MAG: molybdopterin-guanine dinucleotide biosynthesis protein B [Bdellovibrionales bacterium]|nr:molybdopterin-guanine dinucleotide biosynthesis protein B [Bdellovibrionales bacterium]